MKYKKQDTIRNMHNMTFNDKYGTKNKNDD